MRSNLFSLLFVVLLGIVVKWWHFLPILFHPNIISSCPVDRLVAGPADFVEAVIAQDAHCSVRHIGI
jgi:hypothetical protein